MRPTLHDWIELVLRTKNKRYDLSIIARNYPSLSHAAGTELNFENSLHWSGWLHGAPDVLDDIIETQGYDIEHDHIFPVCGGTTMGIFLACTALLRPGDEVVCERPGWPQVGRLADKFGVNVKWWSLRAENNWRPDVDELARIVTDETKLIYINHPHNPTGACLSPDEMDAICDVARKHDAYIISDEINRGLEWNGRPSPSIVNHYEKGLVAASLSKCLGATGIRYGWLATRDPELYKQCFELYYDSMLCNVYPAEVIGRELIRPARFRELLSESHEIGEKNLAVLKEMTSRSELFEFTPPQGAFVCLVRYHTGEPSWDFFNRMLTREPVGLEFVPGICFGEDCEHHVRVGLGSKPEDFARAVEILEQGAKEFASQKV